MGGSGRTVLKMARRTDVFTASKRSEVMSRIRSTGNERTEIRLIEAFREARVVGWRRNQKVIGRPDFVFAKSRIAVFVDGCFWHGCQRCYRRPRSNQQYWDAKVQRNRRRDRMVNRELRKRGWRVMRIWEHSLKRSPIRQIRRLQALLVAAETTK